MKLETWLWDAACAIRGAMVAPKFKDFILLLVFFKRLSDVFEDEFAECRDELSGPGKKELMATRIRAGGAGGCDSAGKTSRERKVGGLLFQADLSWRDNC